MKAEFRKIAPKEGFYGDCTADYAVVIGEPCTVSQFLDWVINDRSNEWGCIGISHEEKWAQFCEVKCEYRYGKLLSRLPEEYLDKTIVGVTARGGWSAMDYVIELEGGEPCQ